MKVLYDHQTFTLQEYGGISRYFYEIYKEFSCSGDLEVQSTLLFSNNEYIRNTQTLGHIPFFPDIHFKGKRTMMLIMNEVKSSKLYKKGDFDLFHPTYYDPYFLRFRSKKPFVITCLDLIHEKFIQSDLKTLAHKKKLLLRADKILAISESTKKDLIDHYGISDDRIDVTYLASSFGNIENQGQRTSETRFFLFVGKRDLYKNFCFFVKAIAPLLRQYNDLYLHCAGGGQFTNEELNLFTELRIENKIKSSSGSDDILKKLYSAAVAFFYPSLYEGFGIPLLEAMNCGCAVAASNVSSLPEVAGDAACYFDPLNKDSIFSAAHTMLTDNQLRTELIRKGSERCKAFSWQKTAKQTLNAYNKML